MKRRSPHGGAAGDLPPIRRMLVPIDFSTGADHALQRAVLMASNGQQRMELLHVMSPRLQAGQRQKVRRSLERAASLARELGAAAGISEERITATVRTGEPHVQIIRRAREINADLVVMGRSRSAGALRRLLGTTSGRVVRMSDVATLVVGRRPRAPYGRPLIAIEIDPSARSIIELTRRVMACAEAPLRLIHAYQVPLEGFHAVVRDGSSRWYFRRSRKVVEESVDKLLLSIGLRPGAVKVVLRRGDAGDAILTEAAHCHADLVALGTHGRGGVAHALLGSIAQWVIANTTRDVLVSRPVRFTFVAP